MKNLLVATDLSERSACAVERAFSIAEQTGAALKLLHVTDSDLPEDLARTVQHEAMQRLTTMIAARPEVAAKIEAAISDPLTKIHEVAEALEADLIVLGVHRHRPLADMFSSTTMERLVRGTARPVLLVKDAVEGPYRRPLCGVDLSPACLAAANAAARLAPEADIESFYAFHAPFRGLGGARMKEQIAPFLAQAQAELENWMASVDLPLRFRKPTPVAAGVRHALDMAFAEVKPDLLAIGAHGRSSFSPNLLGSFTEELVRRPICDTLVARG